MKALVGGWISSEIDGGRRRERVAGREVGGGDGERERHRERDRGDEVQHRLPALAAA